jgi:hypothetical protein
MHSFQKYHFKDQHEHEEILQVIHRHWFDIFIQFIIVIVALAVAGCALFFTAVFYPNVFDVLGTQTVYFIETTFLIMLWFYSFLIWIDYYLDVWIITNERILNIEQRGLFVRHSSELQLGNVQDITTEVTGIIPTILNYGDVLVQTAGERERFVFRHVPDPYAVKGLIMQLYQKTKNKAGNI